MRRVGFNTLAFLFMAVGVLLCLSAFLVTTPASAEETKAPEGQATPPGEGSPDAVAAPSAPAPEPTRVEGKLTKVDAETKMITVQVEPDRNSSSRAFRKFKMKLDEKSLVLIDQQPGTMAGLEEGQIVQVMFVKKGKEDIVDTVVVMQKAETD